MSPHGRAEFDIAKNVCFDPIEKAVVIQENVGGNGHGCGGNLHHCIVIRWQRGTFRLFRCTVGSLGQGYNVCLPILLHFRTLQFWCGSVDLDSGLGRRNV